MLFSARTHLLWLGLGHAVPDREEHEDPKQGEALDQITLVYPRSQKAWPHPAILVGGVRHGDHGRGLRQAGRNRRRSPAAAPANVARAARPAPRRAQTLRGLRFYTLRPWREMLSGYPSGTEHCTSLCSKAGSLPGDGLRLSAHITGMPSAIVAMRLRRRRGARRMTMTTPAAGLFHERLPLVLAASCVRPLKSARVRQGTARVVQRAVQRLTPHARGRNGAIQEGSQQHRRTGTTRDIQADVQG